MDVSKLLFKHFWLTGNPSIHNTSVNGGVTSAEFDVATGA